MKSGGLKKIKYIDSIVKRAPVKRASLRLKKERAAAVHLVLAKKKIEPKRKPGVSFGQIFNSYLEWIFGTIGQTFKRSFVIWKFSLVLLVLVSIVQVSAFEAHIVNVTATLLNIDPPVITPPGGNYDGPVDITIGDNDPDATYIFYTITPGTDPGVAPDPACGVLPGGPKPIGPITLADDSVVKAIACDGPNGSAHHSLITTEIYDLTLKAKIEGRKYNDLDRSEGFSVGDTPVEGWRVDLRIGTSTVGTTVTDATGYYAFNNLDPANYTVVEESRTGWQSVSPSSVSATITGNETKTVNFFNFDSGFACVPSTVVFPDKLAIQASGLTSGNDDVVLGTNATVHGDVRSNDEIEKSASSSNQYINGNAMAVHGIDAGIIISGASSTGVSSVALPNVNIAAWESRAHDGGVVNGSFTFPSGLSGIVMGPTEIMGNLTLGSSDGLAVRGTIYVHGNLTLGSNATINQDGAFGNQFAVIIVDGLVTIGPGVTFNGASTTGTFLLVSTHAAILGDGAAIDVAADNSDLGDVVLYASNGDIHVRANRTLLAAFATHGTGLDSNDNGAILLDSNVIVNYRTLPSQISCGPRQPYDVTSHVMINEFMPNPVGNDTGTAGGPLDGEWVEIFNPMGAPVDLNGYVLYDNDNTHALPITSANTNTGRTVVPVSGYLVVYREGDADFELNNTGGDTVRLFSGPIELGGALVDSHLYNRDAPDGKSFARVPDGSANWVDPDSTPGEPNSFFFEILPGKTDAFDDAAKPPMIMPELDEPEIQAPDAILNASPSIPEEVKPTEVPSTDVIDNPASNSSSSQDASGPEASSTIETSSTLIGAPTQIPVDVTSTQDGASSSPTAEGQINVALPEESAKAIQPASDPTGGGGGSGAGGETDGANGGQTQPDPIPSPDISTTN